jgi:hypothetical protein
MSPDGQELLTCDQRRRPAGRRYAAAREPAIPQAWELPGFAGTRVFDQLPDITKNGGIKKFGNMKKIYIWT